MPLLIHNAPKIIQNAWAILNFMILAQYILHDNKMLCYMELILYGFEKKKISFQHHQPIEA